jgi:hypothetical protein
MKKSFVTIKNSMPGFVYAIISPPTPDHPEGETIYVGSSQSTETVRFSTWRTQARYDWMSTPLLRHAHSEWGGLDTCTFRVLARVELPADEQAAKTALRHVEDGYITAAKGRDEPLLNTNAPVCRCERKRAQQAAWRAAHPDYMAQKGREWRQRRKIMMEAAEHGH